MTTSRAPRRQRNTDVSSAAGPERMTTRCPWAGSDPLMQAYHDREWGTPLHDERGLFEFLILEGAQAGLSWSTILRKREHYRRAFSGFDPARVAAYGAARIEKLLADPGIVRNRLKVEGAVANAGAYLKLRDEPGGADGFLWRFVGGRPRRNTWKRAQDVPASTPESDAMSRELKRRGFTFVGSTICYAFMQATGMVDDHVPPCFRAGGAGGR
jgi:DNA-3-methyladenine glycosylase I